MNSAKITTKNALIAFVEDKANADHCYFSDIAAVLESVKDQHGRSAAAREAVKTAEGLRSSKTPSGTKTEKKGKTAPKKAARERVVADPSDPARTCLCGCDVAPAGKKSRFAQGHDARLKGMVLRTVRKGEANVFSAEAIEFISNWPLIKEEERTLFATNVRASK